MNNGIKSENLVIENLQAKNFIILGTRIKNLLGEIDILCLKNNVLYIVEVKERKNINLLKESINEKKINKCLNCLNFYLQEINLNYESLKFIMAFVNNEKIIYQEITI